VLSRLLKEVLAVATRKHDRQLDRAYFLEIFEDETTKRVPSQQLTVLRNLAAISTLPMVSFATGSSEAPFQVCHDRHPASQQQRCELEAMLHPSAEDDWDRRTAANELFASKERKEHMDKSLYNLFPL
jgi:hypothetical protein